MSFEVDFPELNFNQRKMLAKKLISVLPEKQDEHPIDPETGAAVEVYGYEATHNQAIDQAIAAITEYIEGAK